MTTESSLFECLTKLLQEPGVSGSEQPVADEIKRQLAQPGMGKLTMHRDRLGNHWLGFGPAGPPRRLLIAHMDEIGLRVSSIRDDGLLCVAAVGGIDPQLWEGTPVVVHTASGPVPGCVPPVSLHVTDRQGLGPKGRLGIHEIHVDLGASSAQAVAELGVSILDSITWPKTVTKLAGDLVQARSLDDRFACAALVELARKLVANPPSEPTMLAWSVQEEVGLRGARRLAQEFPDCTEVIAIDSYTVGLGPRDNHRFDGPIPGGGPVLRALDATTIVPDKARAAIADRCAALGYPVQVGYMPGGNDASMFEASGARVYGLGVTVQYSHSQAERIHFADLTQLVELLTVLCAQNAPLA